MPLSVEETMRASEDMVQAGLRLQAELANTGVSLAGFETALREAVNAIGEPGLEVDYARDIDDGYTIQEASEALQRFKDGK